MTVFFKLHNISMFVGGDKLTLVYRLAFGDKGKPHCPRPWILQNYKVQKYHLQELLLLDLVGELTQKLLYEYRTFLSKHCNFPMGRDRTEFQVKRQGLCTSDYYHKRFKINRFIPPEYHLINCFVHANFFKVLDPPFF